MTVETNQLRKTFESVNSKKVFPKGEIIIMQGNKVEDVYLIDEGIVRVADFDRNGEQRVVALLARDHVFPFSWLLNDRSDDGSLYYYQALTDVTCYTVGFEKVRNLVSGNAALSWRLIDVLTKSYFNALSRLQNLQKTNAEEKVDFIIYYLAVLMGKSSGNKIVIDGGFTHQEIADLAGLTRESVSRQLKKSKYDKIISRSDGQVTINVNKLDTDSMPVLFKIGA
jgi:CRP-like cAMP-binding protein